MNKMLKFKKNKKKIIKTKTKTKMEEAKRTKNCT